MGAREVVRVRASCCVKGRNAERVSHRRHTIDELRSVRRIGADILGCNMVVWTELRSIGTLEMVKVSLRLALNAGWAPRADVSPRLTSDALLPLLYTDATAPIMLSIYTVYVNTASHSMMS